MGEKKPKKKALFWLKIVYFFHGEASPRKCSGSEKHRIPRLLQEHPGQEDSLFTHLEISGIVCFIRMANDKDIEAAVGKVRKGNGNILIDDLGMVFQGFRQVLNEGLHLLALSYRRSRRLSFQCGGAPVRIIDNGR